LAGKGNSMLRRIEIDPRTKIKAEDIDLPIVIRINKFDEEGSKHFSEDINKACNSGQEVVPIVVDSYGGQVYSLLSMISEIQNCKLPVATICESKAMSAGAILFGFGNNGLRFMSEHATIMLHDVSNFTYGKIEELKADVFQTEKLNKHIFSLLAKNCNQLPNYFLDIIHQKSHAEWFLSAKEAKKHKLCNHIRLPEISLKVKIIHEFI
jgi:ATP-dependent protease ClpP protease subunit